MATLAAALVVSPAHASSAAIATDGRLAFSSVLVTYAEGDQSPPDIDPIRLARIKTTWLNGLKYSAQYTGRMLDGSYVFDVGPIETTWSYWNSTIAGTLDNADPAIVAVAPDYRMEIASEVNTNDPWLYPLQWNLQDRNPGGINALAAWDPEWRFAAAEGPTGYGYVDREPGAAPVYRLVRFGTYAAGWLNKEVSGDFLCTTAFFGGDPAPGQRKICEIATTWKRAAIENNNFVVTDPLGQWVRFGGATNWLYAFLTPGSHNCNISQFPGTDPLFGSTKICQFQDRKDGGGIVALDNQPFTLSGTQAQTVRYGAVNDWLYKDLPPGSNYCALSTFDSAALPRDPAFGVVKHCELVKTRGTGVTIAVNDSGFASHNDIDNKWSAGRNFVGGSINDDPQGPKECRWHGLGVSGVAAAETNNERYLRDAYGRWSPTYWGDIAGVAPGARVQMNKVISCGNPKVNTKRAVINAVTWAAGGPRLVNSMPNPSPAKVINLSLGTAEAAFDEDGNAMGCDSIWQDTLDYARMQGAVVVVAAGNEEQNLDLHPRIPVGCKNVVVVGATGITGERWQEDADTGSNFGLDLDLSAPGVGIAVLVKDDQGLSQVSSRRGTSLAAPAVSGVAAMMLSKNPGLSPTNLEFRLSASARGFETCAVCGFGVLDADAALQSAEAITRENEPNNTPLTANFISASADVTGVFEAGRPDHYRVALMPGEGIVAGLYSNAVAKHCLMAGGSAPANGGTCQDYTNHTTSTQQIDLTVFTDDDGIGMAYELRVIVVRAPS